MSIANIHVQKSARDLRIYTTTVVITLLLVLQQQIPFQFGKAKHIHPAEQLSSPTAHPLARVTCAQKFFTGKKL